MLTPTASTHLLSLASPWESDRGHGHQFDGHTPPRGDFPLRPSRQAQLSSRAMGMTVCPVRRWVVVANDVGAVLEVLALDGFAPVKIH